MLRTMHDAQSIADQYRALGLDVPAGVQTALEIERAILAAVNPNVGLGAAQLFDEEAMPSPDAVVDAIRDGAFARAVRTEIGAAAEGTRKRMVARSVQALRSGADTTIERLRKPYDEAAAVIVTALQHFPADLYGDLDGVYACGDDAVTAHRAAAPALEQLDLIAAVVDTLAGFAGIDGPTLYATIGDPETLEQASRAFSGNKPVRWLRLFSIPTVAPRLHTPDEAHAQRSAIRAIVAQREGEAQAEQDREREERKAEFRRQREIEDAQQPRPARPRATTRR